MPNHGAYHGAGREAVNEAVHEAGYECIVSLLSTVVCTIGGSTRLIMGQEEILSALITSLLTGTQKVERGRRAAQVRPTNHILDYFSKANSSPHADV
mgnify:CR=1 FL=1